MAPIPIPLDTIDTSSHMQVLYRTASGVWNYQGGIPSLYGSYFAKSATIMLTITKAIAVITGIFLSYRIYMANKINKEQSYGEQQKKSFILPIYRTLLYIVLLLFTIEIALLNIWEWSRNWFYFSIWELIIQSLTCEGFVQPLTGVSVSSRSFAQSLLYMIPIAAYGAGFGYLAELTNKQTGNHIFSVMALYHFFPCLYHVFIFFPWPSGSVIMPKRLPIRSFSRWMFVYRMLWSLFNVYMYLNEFLEWHYIIPTYLFLGFLALLEIPFSLIIVVMVRVDTIYWHYGARNFLRSYSKQIARENKQLHQQGLAISFRHDDASTYAFTYENITTYLLKFCSNTLTNSPLTDVDRLLLFVPLVDSHLKEWLVTYLEKMKLEQIQMQKEQENEAISNNNLSTPISTISSSASNNNIPQITTNIHNNKTAKIGDKKLNTVRFSNVDESITTDKKHQIEKTKDKNNQKSSNDDELSPNQLRDFFTHVNQENMQDFQGENQITIDNKVLEVTTAAQRQVQSAAYGISESLPSSSNKKAIDMISSTDNYVAIDSELAENVTSANDDYLYESTAATEQNRRISICASESTFYRVMRWLAAFSLDILSFGLYSLFETYFHDYTQDDNDEKTHKVSNSDDIKSSETIPADNQQNNTSGQYNEAISHRQLRLLDDAEDGTLDVLQQVIDDNYRSLIALSQLEIFSNKILGQGSFALVFLGELSLHARQSHKATSPESYLLPRRYVGLFDVFLHSIARQYKSNPLSFYIPQHFAEQQDVMGSYHLLHNTLLTQQYQDDMFLNTLQPDVLARSQVQLSDIRPQSVLERILDCLLMPSLPARNIDARLDLDITKDIFAVPDRLSTIGMWQAQLYTYTMLTRTDSLIDLLPIILPPFPLNDELLSNTVELTSNSSSSDPSLMDKTMPSPQFPARSQLSSFFHDLLINNIESGVHKLQQQQQQQPKGVDANDNNFIGLDNDVIPLEYINLHAGLSLTTLLYVQHIIYHLNKNHLRPKNSTFHPSQLFENKNIGLSGLSLSSLYPPASKSSQGSSSTPSTTTTATQTQTKTQQIPASSSSILLSNISIGSDLQPGSISHTTQKISNYTLSILDIYRTHSLCTSLDFYSAPISNDISEFVSILHQNNYTTSHKSQTSHPSSSSSSSSLSLTPSTSSLDNKFQSPTIIASISQELNSLPPIMTAFSCKSPTTLPTSQTVSILSPQSHNNLQNSFSTTYSLKSPNISSIELLQNSLREAHLIQAFIQHHRFELQHCISKLISPSSAIIAKSECGRQRDLFLEKLRRVGGYSPSLSNDSNELDNDAILTDKLKHSQLPRKLKKAFKIASKEKLLQNEDDSSSLSQQQQQQQQQQKYDVELAPSNIIITDKSSFNNINNSYNETSGTTYDYIPTPFGTPLLDCPGPDSDFFINKNASISPLTAVSSSSSSSSNNYTTIHLNPKAFLREGIPAKLNNPQESMLFAQTSKYNTLLAQSSDSTILQSSTSSSSSPATLSSSTTNDAVTAGNSNSIILDDGLTSNLLETTLNFKPLIPPRQSNWFEKYIFKPHIRAVELVAIKFFRKSMEFKSHDVLEISKETSLHSQLTHPNLVHCYGILVAPPTLAVVTELCSRGDLQGLIEKQGKLREYFLRITDEIHIAIRAFYATVKILSDEQANTLKNNTANTTVTNNNANDLCALTSTNSSQTAITTTTATSTIQSSPSNTTNSNDLEVTSSFSQHPFEFHVAAAAALISPILYLQNNFNRGRLLLQHVHACHRRLVLIGSQLLSLRMRLFMAHDAARGVAYLHENKILHRDIKSPNFLINENNIVKLGDFGISKTIQDDVKKRNADDKDIIYSHNSLNREVISPHNFIQNISMNVLQQKSQQQKHQQTDHSTAPSALDGISSLDDTIFDKQEQSVPPLSLDQSDSVWFVDFSSVTQHLDNLRSCIMYATQLTRNYFYQRAKSRFQQNYCPDPSLSSKHFNDDTCNSSDVPLYQQHIPAAKTHSTSMIDVTYLSGDKLFAHVLLQRICEWFTYERVDTPSKLIPPYISQIPNNSPLPLSSQQPRCNVLTTPALFIDQKMLNYGTLNLSKIYKDESLTMTRTEIRKLREAQRASGITKKQAIPDYFCDPMGDLLHIVSLDGEETIFPILSLKAKTNATLDGDDVYITMDNTSNDIKTNKQSSKINGILRGSQTQSAYDEQTSQTLDDFFTTSNSRHNRKNTTQKGTFSWLAPEAFTEHYSYPADIYALGLTLWELLCLQPIDARNCKLTTLQFTQDIPLNIRLLLLSCVDPRPQLRPTAQQIADVILMHIYMLDIVAMYINNAALLKL